MSPDLRVYTLGRLTIELDGIIQDDFVSQKAPALFVYLLHHPREHQRDVLAEMFWSDTSSKQALKNLRTVLSNLQKTLGDYLDVTRQSLTIIETEDIWLDTNTFQTILETVKQRQKQPYSPRRLMTDLETAMKLYQGDFLVGLKASNAPELDTWVMLERELLRSKATFALYQLAEIALENAAYPRGINAARQLLSLDPLWEQGVRSMMRLQTYSGNRTAAIKHYDSFAKLLQKELDIEPEEETKALYRDIKTGRVQVIEPKPKPNNLYQPSYAYVENTSLVEQINTRLNDPNCRLLTIQGLGGVGKTRLAQHIAHLRLEDYRHGVFFVPLASITSLELIPQAIINALDIQYVDTRRSPQENLLEHLRDCHLLLVLDNFEHIMGAVSLVQTILEQAAYVQILVTSREQLQLQAEHVFTLEGLPYPENGHDADKYEAVQLFAQTAQQVKSDFELAEHSDSVGEICRLVNGLPLAIMIAAGLAQFLHPQEIAERIHENLGFLTISRHDLPQRHRGIIALLNSTWSDLIEHEKGILEKLAVFPNDFDADAAKNIADAHLNDLNTLVAKSLLQTEENERFSLHELLRRYTRDHANENILAKTRQIFIQYYREWVQDLLERGLAVHIQYEIIDREYHNLWIVDWLSEEETHHHILHLTPILVDYWIARSYPLPDAIQLLQAALPHAENDWLKANGLVYLGRLLLVEHQHEEALKLITEALSLSKSIGNAFLQITAMNEIERLLAATGDFEGSRDYLLQMIDLCEKQDLDNAPRIKRLLATAQLNLGVVNLSLENLEEAIHYCQLALENKLMIDDLHGAAISHNTLGIIALDQNDYDTAHENFAAALDIAHQIEHTRYQTIFSGNLAEALHKQGKLNEAYQIYCQTLQTAFSINNYKTILNVLEQLCDVALDLNNPKRAARLLGAAIRLREQVKIAIEPRQQEEFASREHRIIKALGSTAYEDLLDEGHTMALEAIIQYAVELSTIKIQ